MLALIAATLGQPHYYARVSTIIRVSKTTDPASLASQLTPLGENPDLIADELRLINPSPPWRPGTPLHVPKYVPEPRLPGATLSRWHAAVRAAVHYGVHPALLIAIACQENPYRDDYACGVKVAKGTDLLTQMMWCARIIVRLCNRFGYEPLTITYPQLKRIGHIYCPTDSHWAPSVWTLFITAKGGRRNASR